MMKRTLISLGVSALALGATTAAQDISSADIESAIQDFIGSVSDPATRAPLPDPPPPTRVLDPMKGRSAGYG